MEPNTNEFNRISTSTGNPVIDGHGQRQVEDIFTKTRRVLKRNWDQTFSSLAELKKKIRDMTPDQVQQLIYWRNPIVSGIAFGISLSVVITFMFLSTLAAVSFWLLALLILIGLYKMYNYVMATFVGRIQPDLFESIFPPDVHVSERQAQVWANSIRANGTDLLRRGQNLFLWNNLTNSLMFGLALVGFFYLGLAVNTLTLVLIGLIFLFIVPKIYQVYQVPIDRVAKQVLDQVNQLLAKVTSKLPSKAKKA